MTFLIPSSLFFPTCRAPSPSWPNRCEARAPVPSALSPPPRSTCPFLGGKSSPFLPASPRMGGAGAGYFPSGFSEKEFTGHRSARILNAVLFFFLEASRIFSFSHRFLLPLFCPYLSLFPYFVVFSPGQNLFAKRRQDPPGREAAPLPPATSLNELFDPGPFGTVRHPSFSQPLPREYRSGRPAPPRAGSALTFLPLQQGFFSKVLVVRLRRLPGARATLPRSFFSGAQAIPSDPTD